MADFGYDVADYTSVDPQLGSLEIFDELVEEAHRRGIAILIDYVPNHTSSQHPWFLAARSSREDPKRDWYIWREAQLGGGLPNNWGSVFGGPAWEWDEATRQFYFHQFLKEQPDLNWRNPQVQAAMFDVLRFWLQRGVDGFRMDVVGMIFKHPEMPDQPVSPDLVNGLPANDLYGCQLHLYDQDQKEVYAMAKQFRQLVESYGDKCLVGEILWHDLDRWARYYGENGDGLHLPFYFRLMDLPWEAAAFRAAVEEVEKAVAETGWPNYVLGNHDQARLASRYGAEQARVAAMLLLTLRGTPTLYYGDELGLENGRIPPQKIQDPWGINIGPERNRDVSRTPMQWDGSRHAGFSQKEPWLPVSADCSVKNVAAEARDPASMLNLYRQLIWSRKRSPALQTGKYQAAPSPAGVYAYMRSAGAERKWIALNFTGVEKKILLPEDGMIRISTRLDRAGTVGESAVLLRPHEGILVDLG